MKELRIGLIGTGTISHRHMDVWAHVPKVKVVAAADIDEKKLRLWGEQYGIAALYIDFREMLRRDDLDAIDVCVHNNLHAPVSMTVLKAGFPCYSEKPMSATYYDSKLLYDCAKDTGQKLAIQISSLFSGQTYIAKRLMEAGKLGEVYHARSVSSSRRRRPYVDADASFAPASFQDKAMAGHGPIVDIGVYYIGQMLYLLGLPELDAVFGNLYQKIPVPTGSGMVGKTVGVEDMGAGYATFKGGLSLEFIQSAATNAPEPETSYITGTQGAITFTGIDGFGGVWGWGDEFGGIPEEFQHTLHFSGKDELGFPVETDYRSFATQSDMVYAEPEMMMWFDNQYHWYKYLMGELTDATRYDTPLIGLNASLLTEGLVLSSALGRSVTADEIRASSKSMAIWKQETPWGIFDYEATK